MRGFLGRIGPPWVPVVVLAAVAFLAFALLKAVGGGGGSSAAGVREDEARVALFLAKTRHAEVRSMHLVSTDTRGLATVVRTFRVTTTDGRSWTCTQRRAVGGPRTACHPG